MTCDDEDVHRAYFEGARVRRKRAPPAAARYFFGVEIATELFVYSRTSTVRSCSETRMRSSADRERSSLGNRRFVKCYFVTYGILRVVKYVRETKDNSLETCRYVNLSSASRHLRL